MFLLSAEQMENQRGQITFSKTIQLVSGRVGPTESLSFLPCDFGSCLKIGNMAGTKKKGNVIKREDEMHLFCSVVKF